MNETIAKCPTCDFSFQFERIATTHTGRGGTVNIGVYKCPSCGGFSE